jgi:hypothetical protein
MNYLYASLYVVICIVIFMVIFMSNELFTFFFEIKPDNITDCNDPKFIGGYKYVFNLSRHLQM